MSLSALKAFCLLVFVNDEKEFNDLKVTLESKGLELQAEVKELESKKSSLSKDVSVLEQKLQSIKAELSKLLGN